MDGPRRVKMPVDSSGSVVISINFSHDCTHVLYAQLVQTGSALLLLQVYNMLGFTLYSKDTGDGRAVRHKLYRYAMEVWSVPMLFSPFSFLINWPA